jgi:hypothetical protein
MEGLKVFNPVAQKISIHFKPAERVKGLRSITVGLVWNGKAGGDIALRRVAEDLKKELGYDFRTVEFCDDFPFAPFTIERVAASCQAVIASTGD